MTTKKSFFLLNILLCIGGTKALAFDIAVENANGVTIYYNYINDATELEVTFKHPYNYKNPDDVYRGNIDIPEEVTYMDRTRKVTSIGNSAFWRCSNLTSITIPHSITSIDEQAFYGCSDLKSLVIPNSVTAIRYCAFAGCISLTSIKVEEGNTVYDSRDECNAVINTTNSMLVVGCQNTVIPNSVRSIGNAAFLDCTSLTSISIPNSVTAIGSEAFEYCIGLTSAMIPNSITSIGEYAFSLCDIPEVISKIENPFTIQTNTFSDNTYSTATLYVPVGTSNNYKAAEGWSKFENIKEGDPSGITHKEVEGAQEIKRYSMNGQVIKNSRKGINIIQMNNGSTRKVVVR